MYELEKDKEDGLLYLKYSDMEPFGTDFIQIDFTEWKKIMSELKFLKLSNMESCFDVFHHFKYPIKIYKSRYLSKYFYIHFKLKLKCIHI